MTTRAHEKCDLKQNKTESAYVQLAKGASKAQLMCRSQTEQFTQQQDSIAYDKDYLALQARQGRYMYNQLLIHPPT